MTTLDDHVAWLEARVRELERENARLSAELGKPLSPAPDHDGAAIATEERRSSGAVSSNGRARTSSRTPAEKIGLFRSRFVGREDLYARRWESQGGTRAGYAPVCTNEWRPGVCRKPEVPCNACTHRAFEPVNDDAVRRHLRGEQVMGLYALDRASHTRFVVIDLDHARWREDARALLATCSRLDVPSLGEISRSGDGAHVWLFFDAPVAASAARRLATALIERTCREEHLLALSSHDRLIPAQDALSGAGFGSLVALPLQRKARDRGASVFVDEALAPVADQWAALETVTLIVAGSLEALVLRVEDGHGGASLADPEADAAPWRRRPGKRAPISPETLPTSVTVTLANGLYVARAELPQPLVYAIARLAAFPNPHWHELARTHRSTWNVARFVEKAESHPEHVRLPRGCREAVAALLEAHNVALVERDERRAGAALRCTFVGTLRDQQDAARTALLGADTGILHAPPGFGKTVVAAATIAHRSRTTLVIVHTTALLRQWRARLAEHLGQPPPRSADSAAARRFASPAHSTLPSCRVSCGSTTPRSRRRSPRTGR